ncbi:MAG: hypothetical protein M1538_03810 [Candidatus Marsarchaeota archaeon]|jgi:hypothetical protein|nr:hypothetical protein [Candidatus Marsarchaeota archaeon]
MVAINFSPINEIVIHDYLYVNKEDLIRSRVTPAGNFPLYWCNGILFAFGSLPWTDEIISDYLKGRVHWSELQFTKMEKYQPVLELNDEEYKGSFKVRVIDTSKSMLHQSIAKWILEQEKKFKKV